MSGEFDLSYVTSNTTAGLPKGLLWQDVPGFLKATRHYHTIVRKGEESVIETEIETTPGEPVKGIDCYGFSVTFVLYDDCLLD